jgi:DNA-binding transcriptional LysR family regulator
MGGIACSGHFLGGWLLLLLSRERPLDRPVHPAAEGIDVDIRVGGRREPHLYAERLATNRRVFCASPEYLDRRGRPKPLHLAARCA